MDRAYLWLNRARKLMGICPEDYFASMFWKKYFLEQGDIEKASHETAILKRTRAHPFNELKVCAFSDYAYHFLIGASIGFFLVFILSISKAARQDSLSNTKNVKDREWIKKSYLYQIIAKGSQTFKRLLKLIPIFTAFVGIIILFLNDEKYNIYYISIIFFFLFIYIFLVSKKCTLKSFISSISSSERWVLGISLFLFIMAAICVLVTDKAYSCIYYNIPFGICDSLGHSKIVHGMEDLLKEKDTDAVRYAAAVMNHMAGNMNRAAELYKSLPYDHRAQKNLEELKKNNPVPPVPLLSEDIFLAYDSVSWKKFFIDFFEDIEYVILFAFAVSSIWGFLLYGYPAYSPGMITAFGTVIVHLDYNFPLPHSLSNGKDFMETFRWEIFWNWPGAKIFWGAVILSAIISLILHISRFRKIWRSCK